jgi:hypothetical protein
MASAIDGYRKTETRRVVKPQPDPEFGFDAWMPGDDGEWYCYVSDYPDEGSQMWRCPYGARGHRLWVRECWTPDAVDVYPFQDTAYRAEYTDHDAAELANDVRQHRDFRWRPSIHMPKDRARIWLEVESVRVERLQHGLDVAAVRAEGIVVPDVDYTVPERPDVLDYEQLGYALEKFSELWDKLNAKRGFAWATNPWVWVVKFRRVR